MLDSFTLSRSDLILLYRSLLEAVTMDDLTNDEEYTEIVEDMRDECGKYGQVRNTCNSRSAVTRMASCCLKLSWLLLLHNSPVESAVRSAVQLTSPTEASHALPTLTLLRNPAQVMNVVIPRPGQGGAPNPPGVGKVRRQHDHHEGRGLWQQRCLALSRDASSE